MSKYINQKQLLMSLSDWQFGSQDDDRLWETIEKVINSIESLPTIEVSEDCISREYILGEAFMSDEYNRETKSFDLPVVSVRDIEDAPSVVPTTEQSSMVGEWIVADDESILFTVPFTEWIKLFCERHRLSDANVEIIKDILMKGEDDE